MSPTPSDLAFATWRKSSYSQGQYECVEVADGFPHHVPVRDSKNPVGPALILPNTTWLSFTEAVKAGPLT
ncbi:DUF397 domain-containing protein [Streptomyces triculaminicus]|uniref:DUF397 domain-containing protein n=1 Tax=Streptomyces triculaminicus TaxID=2816232 RepID=UPI0037A35BA8